MVSSALSSRRTYLRRPKVCKTLPNPGRCEKPPPPEPPPPPWRYGLLDLMFEADWYGAKATHCTGHWEDTLEFDAEHNGWLKANITNTGGRLEFHAYIEEAGLLLDVAWHVYGPMFCDSYGEKAHIPFEEEEGYEINIPEWDSVYPPDGEWTMWLILHAA